MKWIRRAAKIVFIIAAALIIFVFLIIGPIDREPIESTDSYHHTMSVLDTLSPSLLSAKGQLTVAWGKVNITPSEPMPLAGYTLREDFNNVHDSLYCRVMAIRSAEKTVYIISADLLLFPPSIRQNIEHLLQNNPNTFLFFSATHTHNGVGGWDDSMAGNFVLGRYREQWVKGVSQSIVNLIKNLSFQPASINYLESEANEYSINRVDNSSPADSKLRGIRIVRHDSSKAILVTYSAHATSINKRSLTLSGDYPSALISELENQGFDFGLFLSGMVGSHRLTGIEEQEFDMVAQAGKVLSEKILHANQSVSLDSASLAAVNFPIEFNDSQMRISKDWKIRDWAFRLVLHPLQGNLSVVEIGNILLIGTPCDFSGEIAVEHRLNSLAETYGKKLIITSFNGNYDGYITADHHYETSHKEEIRALNWVGPYHGDYFAEMIKKVISR